MLSEAVIDLATLRYPLYASPKLDGFRAFMYHGTLMSRNFKPIPNLAIQDLFSKLPHGWDGELIVGKANASDCFNRTSSQVTTRQGSADNVVYHVFDNYTMDRPFVERILTIPEHHRVAHYQVDSPEMILAYEFQVLSAGYEGIILRDPQGKYKHGRSTLREQGMLKLKRFKDDEAQVIDCEEMMHNANEAKVDGQGFTERSSHQAGLVPTGVLGALVVNWKGHTLRIGTGFTQEQRAALWANKPIGRFAKFKYLEIGMKELPRHPVWLGWRDKRDM
jgi:DNA ligase-1